MTRPTLYGASYSVYVRIARLALHEKGVAYRHVPIDIFSPDSIPDDYVRLHPFLRIPAFTHGDLTLYETQAITRYVDEAFAGPALQPAEADERARMTQVIGIVDAYAYCTLVWDIYVERVSKRARGEACDEARIADALPRARTCLAALRDILADKSHFCASGLSLADLHLAPVIGYFAETPEAGMMDAFPALARWWAGMQARESWAVCRTDSAD